MRSKLRPLQNHHSIHILDRKALLVQQFSRLLEKQQAVCTLPLRIVVRKMCPDISEPRRAQKRITKCMSEHIPIRMSDRPLVERNFRSSNNQLPTFRQSVQVVSNPAANAHTFFGSECR